MRNKLTTFLANVLIWAIKAFYKIAFVFLPTLFVLFVSFAIAMIFELSIFEGAVVYLVIDHIGRAGEEIKEGAKAENERRKSDASVARSDADSNP